MDRCVIRVGWFMDRRVIRVGCLMDRRVIRLCWLIVVLCYADAAPVLTSDTQNITRVFRENAEFNCVVQDSENPTHSVVWTNVKENVVIAVDTDVLAHQFKYAVSQQTSRNVEDTTIYTLQIYSIVWQDQGPYQCTIDAARLSQMHFLYVRGSVDKPDAEDLPPANFTSCCVAERVTPYCQALCSPATLDILSFDEERCFGDLPKLLTCGSDGKNHAACCSQRLVPPYCLDYCRGLVPSDFNDTEQAFCLQRADDILACFAEGQHIIPGPVWLAMADATSATEVRVTWSPPTTDVHLVIAYKVFYQVNGRTGYSSTDLIRTADAAHDGSISTVVQHLQPATQYNIYIISIGHHGTSQPSQIVRIRTKSGVLLPPGTEELHLSECCLERQVSDKCQGFLCGGTYIPLSASDKLSCYSHMDAVLTCLSGEKDHSDCCTRRGLQPRCLPLCTGSVLSMSTSFHYLDCLERMPDVASCIQEGRGTLPNPPKQLRVTNVTSTSAFVSWQENRSGHIHITAYILEYRKAVDTSYIRVVVEATQYWLSDLEHGTEYEARVSTEGSLGSSLPTPSLFFLTYLQDGGVGATTPGPAPTPPAHDVLQCCHDSGVEEECRAMCDYGMNHTQQVAVPTFLSCQTSVGHVFKCGADGRNHTPCCERRNVPDVCFKYCAMTQQQAEEFSFNFDDLECFEHVYEVVQCMQEGLDTLPGPPHGVHVVSVTQHTVSLAWSEPHRNPQRVRAYYVHIVDMQTNCVTLGARTISKAYNVPDLKPGAEYSFSVIAVNSDGESLPSESLSMRTQGSNPVHLLNVTVPTDLTECCRTKGMGEDCLHICAGSAVINVHQCGGQLGVAIQCAADQKDHTPCCREHSVSEHCLPFCRGNTDVHDFTSLLCVGYTEQFMACFRAGYDILPTMPVDFHIAEVSSHHVVFEWAESNVEGVSYMLHYKEQAANHFVYREAISSPYTLHTLRPSAHYQAYLIAYNQYGSSLPTAEIDFWTNIEEIPQVIITQTPMGVLKENMPLIMLACWTEGGTGAGRIYWKRLAVITENSVYNITKVARRDAGRYTCVATTAHGAQVASDVYLQVQYEPEASAVRAVVRVQPDAGRTAMLACHFLGLPDHIQWFKDGRQLQPTADTLNNKLSINRLMDQTLGVMTSQLVVNRVSDDDIGTYKCMGTNALGQHMALIHMLAPGSSPVMTVAPPVLDVRQCCEDRGVTEACTIACTFDLDLSRILDELEDPFECVDQLPILVSCSADGKNHTRCCAARGVPAACHAFCYGAAQDLNSDHIQCLPYFDTIGDCMQEGRAKLPSAAQSVRGRIVDGFIRVQWHQPEAHPERVTYYDVHYEAPAYAVFNRTSTVEKEMRSLNIHGVHSFATYNIYVVSRNHWGVSQRSNAISVQTYEQYPGAPQRLSGHVVQSNPTHIRLHWQQPLQNLGAVTHYEIYYGINGEYCRQNTSHATYTYRLEQLREQTTYDIFVTSFSHHFKSLHSNNITMTTGAALRQKAERQQVDRVGIGVGVAIVVMVLIGIAAALVYYFTRIRPAVNKHTRFENSVQFDNPGFSKSENVEITGTPTGVSLNQLIKQPPDEDNSAIAEVTGAHAQVYSNDEPQLSNGVDNVKSYLTQPDNPLYEQTNADTGQLNWSFDVSEEKA